MIKFVYLDETKSKFYAQKAGNQVTMSLSLIYKCYAGGTNGNGEPRV